MKTPIRTSSSSVSTFFHTRLPVVCAFVLLSLSPSPADATNYYFSQGGTHGANGLTPGTAKKDLSEAIALAVPGNALLFRRGEAWYSPVAGFDLQGKTGSVSSPLYIGAYDTGANPIIATLDLISNSGWTRVGTSTTWQHTVSGYSDAWRLFVNGASKYKVNTNDPTANETDVNQTYEWYIKSTSPGVSGIIYANSGSTSVPPQNVEVHPVGAVSAMIMKSTNYVTVQNIDFRGGSQYNVINVAAPCSHLVFDHNSITRANASGIVVGNLESVTTDYVANIDITYNLFDKIWTTYEDNTPAALGGDGIFILHAADNGLIKDNTVTNWGHVGITLTTYRAGFHGVRNFIVDHNNVSSGQSGYMHAFDMDGFEDTTTDNIVRRNYLHDYQATCHVEGDHNKVYSNIFARVTTTPLATHPTKQPYGLDLAPWLYTDPNDGSTHWMVSHDNIVANNTFYSSDGYSIVMSDSSSNPTEVAQNLIYNNIMCNYGGSFNLGLYVDNSVRGHTYVRNNNFWDGSTSAAVARYPNTGMVNYTAAQLNTTFTNYCSNNKQLDPQLADPVNNNFGLTSTSPTELRSGGLPISSMMDSGFVDYFGNPWHPTAPSMGAIQVPF